MELKLHLYSITWVASILKPMDPGTLLVPGTCNLEPGSYNLELRAWNLEPGAETGSSPMLKPWIFEIRSPMLKPWIFEVQSPMLTPWIFEIRSPMLKPC